MDALALVDTFGAISPHAMQYFVNQVKARIVTRLETHFHMDFGVGIANTIIALAEGVEVMHTTVLGIGERAGNVPMEETVLALLTMYGIDVGLKYERLFELAKLVQGFSNHLIPSNRPVIGDALFNIESGIITSWWKNCGYDKATELFPYRWEIVGQKPAEPVLGKGSGIDSVHTWLQKIGIQVSDESAQRILSEVKDLSLNKKGLVSEVEFMNIIDRLEHNE
jgi:isopropylmalate/homocitrate/citramalate synthase